MLKMELNDMTRVVWFEIPADDLGRAAKFYEDVFGWKIDRWDSPFDYWLVTNEKDDEQYINGALTTKDEKKSVRYNKFINVDSYDESANKIEIEGGKMLTRKMNIPGIGKMGSFQDTEGNVLAIVESN